MARESSTFSPSSSGQGQWWDPGTWKDAVSWNTNYIYSRAAQLGLLAQPELYTNGRQQANNVVQHHQRCDHCPLDVKVDQASQVRNRVSGKWFCDLKHNVRQAVDAAASGCSFFVWLCDQVIISSTPVKQLERTVISMEFKARKEDAHDVYRATLWLRTMHYSWSLGDFAVFSAPDDLSARRAIARSIKGDVSSDESRRQIQGRLKECLENHTLCSNNKSHIRPPRLLDIRDKDNAKVCSLDATRLDQYVALSYCWGEDQPFKTTLSTLGSRKEGISVSALPKTIRDAIEITRQLNIDFLWVDSLCIVQDSEDEKAKEVGDMSHYYGNSLLTISAAKARVCSEGFLAPGGAGERFEQYRNGPFQLKLAFDDFKCEIITLAQEEPPPKEPIDTRGWTLQEGLLATRLVSFGDSSTWWSCSTSTYRLSSIPTLREEAKELRKIPALRGSDWQSLMLWNKIIQDYSARTLKFPADKLPAISGIAQELSAAFPPPEQLDMPKYVAGLWNVRTLPLQLLWTPMRGLTRYSDDVDSDYVAPSWSWASVSGAISPDIFLNPSDQIVESEVMIVDCKVDRVNQHAPYGALSGASLTLKSKAWDDNFENQCEEGVELRLDTAEDEKAVRAVGGEVTCLAVIRPKYAYQLKETQQSIDTTPKGLVLIKKGVGTYRRVGVYYREYVPSPRESRERWNSYSERTFTIE